MDQRLDIAGMELIRANSQAPRNTTTQQASMHLILNQN